jgi:hypothetical protein
MWSSYPGASYEERVESRRIAEHRPLAIVLHVFGYISHSECAKMQQGEPVPEISLPTSADARRIQREKYKEWTLRCNSDRGYLRSCSDSKISNVRDCQLH